MLDKISLGSLLIVLLAGLAFGDDSFFVLESHLSDGRQFPFATLQGKKAVLITNTASK